MATKVDISTEKGMGETEDLPKIEALKHRGCVLATHPPPPEATPLPGNVPEAANGEGLGHAHLPGAHKVGGARSDRLGFESTGFQSIASCFVLGGEEISLL